MDYFDDVAAVFIDGSFGSGRLIAPGCVLTAGHVIDYPDRATRTLKGWKVRLLRERTKEGAWTAPPHEAEVIWRGQADLDLALVRIEADTKPSLTPIFVSYDKLGTVDGVRATGFPEAWFTPEGMLRDYTVQGGLRRAAQWGPYAWSVASADKPDDPHGWGGMSGSAIYSEAPDNKLYLFGAVQQVPANFSGGMLEVARVSDALADAGFASLLRAALGFEISAVRWEQESGYGYSASGLSELVEQLKAQDDRLEKLSGRAAVSEKALVAIARRLSVENVPTDELGPALIDRIDRLHLAQDQVDALPGSHADPIKSLAEAATERGDYERAEKLVAARQAQVQAVTLLDEGKPDQAIAALADLEKQLGGVSNEGPFEARIVLGYVYKTFQQAFSQTGDTARAQQYLEKALSVFQALEQETVPEEKTLIPFASVMNALGNLCAAQSQHRDAIHYYQAATSLLPGYAYAWHDMFLSYYQLAEQGSADLTEMARALAKTKETGQGVPPFDRNYFEGLDQMMASVQPPGRGRKPGAKPTPHRRKSAR